MARSTPRGRTSPFSAPPAPYATSLSAPLVHAPRPSSSSRPPSSISPDSGGSGATLPHPFPPLSLRSGEQPATVAPSSSDPVSKRRWRPPPPSSSPLPQIPRASDGGALPHPLPSLSLRSGEPATVAPSPTLSSPLPQIRSGEPATVAPSPTLSLRSGEPKAAQAVASAVSALTGGGSRVQARAAVFRPRCPTSRASEPAAAAASRGTLPPVLPFPLSWASSWHGL
ncbi:classical arabinogalactan protein 9-like [Miscanthus floridulus]|uniref:classical arabinogalactan protein 9-like n=1 Tax=Miscanthus floridulus TaxID=154761 RepID=UPI00345781BC